MVIRVEDEKGNGPYCKYQAYFEGERNDGSLFGMMFWMHCDDHMDHPNAIDDPGIRRGVNTDELFGFATWEQFIEWFTSEEIMLMACNGFYPTMIDVEPTIVGEKQCLFVR